MSSSRRPQARAAARLVSAAAACLCAAMAVGAQAAVDLAALVVVPARGQNDDRARRDRYECHNWAVDETGTMPAAVPAEAPRSAAERAERVDRVIGGAGIGAAIGGLIRAAQDENPANGVLAGAAIGAAVGAATGRRNDAEISAEESDYLRALAACLEGRGYTVEMPPGVESAAQRQSSAAASRLAATSARR
jgi:hypothetical protein